MKQSMNLGGSIVSRNIIENKGKIRWCFRENSVNDVDNGWRFLSDIDTDEYLSASGNLIVCDWGTVFEMEPAISIIFDLPVGTELELLYEHGKKFFINSVTGEKLHF